MALIGTICIIKNAYLSFLKLKNQSFKTQLVLTINRNENSDLDLETKIALSRLRWYNINNYDKVYVVGCNLSNELFENYKIQCLKYDIKLLRDNEYIKEMLGTDYEQ